MNAPLNLPMASPAIAPLRPRGSNQVGMRQYNERVVLQAIRLNGSLPKAELARVTGLSAQTIGLITQRLDDDGLIVREAPLRGRIGQPSIPLSLNPDGAYAIGIKIGRRSTDLLLVDFLGLVRERRAIQYAFPDVDVLLPQINQYLQALTTSLGTRASALVGVGVAAPFRLGGWHKLLGVSEQQSDAWNELDLTTAIQTMTELPVIVAKDTSAACVAELVRGRGRDLKSFLYLFVDTFVGGGLVLNSHWHAGARGNAGAVASLPLQVSAGSSAEKAPEQLLGTASLWELEQRFIEHGLEASAAYDERSLQAPWHAHTLVWLEHAARSLAFAALNGTAIVDVNAVVIDGNVSRDLLELLLVETRLAMQQYNWEGLWAPTLHGGIIGSDARALGGALLPLHANFAPDHEVFIKDANPR